MARAIAAAADDTTKAAARAAYDHEIYAASNHSVRDAHLKGWLTMHRAWYGELVPMLPLTVEKIHNVAALFKQGKYSSFSNYISRAKDAHVSAEMSWSDALAQAHTGRRIRYAGHRACETSHPVRHCEGSGSG